MKKFTILFFSVIMGALSHSQLTDGPGRNVPKPSPEIIALNAEESALKTAGDLKGLQVNRLAQIAAWQKIDPALAAEFKPNAVIQTDLDKITGFSQDRSETFSKSDSRWRTDLQINPFFVNDGVDIDLALDGTIYIASFIMKPGAFDEIYIYKSTNNGTSFSLWGTASTPDVMTKIKLSLMDKGSTKYLFITYSAENGKLQNLRFNLAGGPLSSETIANNVKLFDIDVDYEFAGAPQLYAIYTRSNDGMFSARSSDNGSGFNWGDEHYLGYGAKEIAFTYGKGSTFLSFIGYATGDHFFMSNSGYNSPTGWSDRTTLMTSAVNESKYISLRAERKPYANFRVVCFVSRKQNSPTIKFRGAAEIITPGSVQTKIITGFYPTNVLHWDSWSKKVDGNTAITASFVTEEDRIFYVTDYNNLNFANEVQISDQQVLVGPAKSAIASDANNYQIGTYVSGTSDFGLYFDSNRPTMAVNENIKNKVSFYPNPVESMLTLTSKGKINSIIITNMVGQQVKSFKTEADLAVLNLSGLTSGTYFLQVDINGTIENHKFIKK